jgi:hypothetical protein
MGIDFSYVYDFSIGFWNCSDNVVFWNCSDSVVYWNHKLDFVLHYKLTFNTFGEKEPFYFDLTYFFLSCRSKIKKKYLKYFELFGQCGVLELFGQCGVLELFGQCGVLELFGQCGVLELFGQCGVH